MTDVCTSPPPAPRLYGGDLWSTGLIVMEDLGTVRVRQSAARSGVDKDGERIRREQAKGIG